MFFAPANVTYGLSFMDRTVAVIGIDSMPPPRAWMSQACILVSLDQILVSRNLHLKHLRQNYQLKPRFIILTMKLFWGCSLLTFISALISVAPVLLKVKTTQFVQLNHSSFLWCPVEGAPAPFIVWRKNGIIVQNSTSIRYKLDTVKENKETFSCEVQKNDQVLKKELALYVESEF